MSHESKIVDSKMMLGGISLLVRCCDDPESDQWITLYPGANVRQQLKEHKENVATAHRKLLELRSDVKSYLEEPSA